MAKGGGVICLIRLLMALAVLGMILLMVVTITVAIHDDDDDTYYAPANNHDNDDADTSLHHITGEPPLRYLWMNAEDQMGFGNKLAWYTHWMYLSKQLNYVWVLPPFVNVDTDTSPIADLDIDRIRATLSGQELTNHMFQYVRRFANAKTIRHYPVTSWFNRTVLQSYVPVIEYDEWLKLSHGRVTVALAEGNPQSGCLPIYEAQCKLPPSKRDAWRVSRFGVSSPSLYAPRLTCLTDLQQAAASSYDTIGIAAEATWRDIPPTSITTLTQLFDVFSRLPSPSHHHHGRDAAPYTIALDGFCYSGMIDVMHFGSSASSMRSYFRFTSHMTNMAKEFRIGHAMHRYVSLHWRRGDLDLAHPQTSMIAWPPATLAAKVMSIMDTHCEVAMDDKTGGHHNAIDDDSNHSIGYCGFDAIHLATDLIFTRDFDAFRRLIPSSIAIVRYVSNDRVMDTAMDLILASQADYFFSSYSGSSYGRFIWQERDEVYHKDRNTVIY